MDLSITLITPEIMQQLGSDAYDRGVPLDGHHMNPGARAIKDWQIGWLWRQRETLSSLQGSEVSAS